MKQAVFIFVCLAVLSVFAAPLKIGWAMESIDPGKRSIMPGYGYFRPSEGSGDPIYATALVLDNGKESVIFVSLDILNPVDISPRVRAIAKKLLRNFQLTDFLSMRHILTVQSMFIIR